MPTKHKYDLQTYRTTWEDLVPWIEQLYSEYGVRVEMCVSIEPASAELQPTCVLELFRPLPGGRREIVVRDWKSFEYRKPNNAEACFLRMLASALMTLDNDRFRAERQTDLWAVK